MQKYLDNPAIMDKGGDPMYSSASRIATEINADTVQLLNEERLNSSGNAGRRILRISNTPERYRHQRRSGGGPRQLRNQ